MENTKKPNKINLLTNIISSVECNYGMLCKLMNNYFIIFDV